MIVCYIFAITAILAYGFLCHYENKKRATEIANNVAADKDWLDLTDIQNKGFKYTT